MKKYLLIMLLSPLLFSCGGKNDHLGNHTKQGTIGVDVYVVKTQNFHKEYSATGTLLANESVNLTTEVSGKVNKIYFKEGQSVQKGMLLLSLDNEDIQAQLEKATLNTQLLKKELDRKTKLLSIKGISQEVFDQAESNYKTAKANEDLIQAQLDKTEIIAPFSGQIGLRNVSEGGFINSNTTVASLQELNPLKLQFSLPQEYIGDIKKEMEVKFTLSNSDSVYTAKVYAVEPAVNPDTRSVTVRAFVENKQHKLLPGAFVNVNIAFSKIPDAILIPSDAVIPSLNKNSVMLYKDGKVKTKSIDVAYHTNADVLVSSGIQPGDTIITTGLLILKQGMPVKVKEVINTANKK